MFARRVGDAAAVEHGEHVAAVETHWLLFPVDVVIKKNFCFPLSPTIFAPGRLHPRVVLGHRNKQTKYNSEELYFMLLLALKTLLSISQNGINQITSNKQLGNHLNTDIINVSIPFSSFPFN